MRRHIAIPLAIVIFIAALFILLAPNRTGPLPVEISQSNPDKDSAVPNTSWPGPAAPKMNPSSGTGNVYRLDWETSASVRRILAGLDPKARDLFQEGLGYIKSGEFIKARLALRHLGTAYPEGQAKVLADFATGVAHYREGGTPNLLIASDLYKKFMDSYEDDRDVNDLVQIACLDMSLLLIEVMRSSANELQTLISVKGTDNVTQANIDLTAKTMANAEYGAFKGLTYFLKAWPTSPYAALARASLLEVENFLQNEMTPLLLRKTP